MELGDIPCRIIQDTVSVFLSSIRISSSWWDKEDAKSPAVPKFIVVLFDALLFRAKPSSGRGFNDKGGNNVSPMLLELLIRARFFCLLLLSPVPAVAARRIALESSLEGRAKGSTPRRTICKLFSGYNRSKNSCV